jgi:DNA-binding transcriptional LysR family regulator
MRTIDLEALKIFRTVVEEGGVVRAATKLGRVQSNVTTRIRQLEERLGVRLFRRQGRSLCLSSEGRTLLKYAEKLLRLAEEAECELLSGRPRGVMRIGSLESTAGSRLPPILAQYHALYPEVVVELVTGTSAALADQVRGYQMEAAFVSEPFAAPDLHARAVFEERLVLITPKAAGKVASPKDLSQTTLIGFARGCSYRRRIEEWLAGENIQPMRVLEFASYQAMIACVAAGTGFAIVPSSVLSALSAGAAIRQHPLPRRIAHNRTHLIWHGEASPALNGLLDLFEPGAATEPAMAGTDA